MTGGDQPALVAPFGPSQHDPDAAEVERPNQWRP
jgi:hypothetical protein